MSDRAAASERGQFLVRSRFSGSRGDSPAPGIAQICPMITIAMTARATLMPRIFQTRPVLTA